MTVTAAIPACQHCPDCDRPSVHLLSVSGIERGYCSPCLVALFDMLKAAGESHPLPVSLETAVRDVVRPLTHVSWEAAERGDALTLEQLRARHTYGWSDAGVELSPTGPPSSPAVYASIADFYTARGGEWSSEADYGVDHTAARVGMPPQCRWRVSVVASTGDVYANKLCPCTAHAAVLLLGSVRPDPLYADADERFHGWAEAVSRDVTWFRERAAAPHRVVSPPAGPPSQYVER